MCERVTVSSEDMEIEPLSGYAVSDMRSHHYILQKIKLCIIEVQKAGSLLHVWCFSCKELDRVMLSGSLRGAARKFVHIFSE